MFVWLPTGFGKSICYEVLPFMYDYKAARKHQHSEVTSGVSVARSLVIVVSPLISLMTDQVMGLRDRSVAAAIISCGSGVQKELCYK